MFLKNYIRGFIGNQFNSNIILPVINKNQIISLVLLKNFTGLTPKLKDYVIENKFISCVRSD